ncbi:GTP-binding protein [Marinobacter panjinensis]|uniref:GTP-binding protein n=1 Tax=Marinobacter panjinensis TaxID=2576384 RepID=A0A4U6QUR2_9GAMM|nr:AAA family ATPase [Marinobacter panjinensis]MCR8915252.1 AAA family ATPase [Marinobacter panjinensis]TKV64469.1 GTP-binding protein [Marinobacter panjinensis]
MKLRRLQVEQLRQFRQPFVLDDLQPGLNLIHGPNESGKSTLVRAIRAAFFERYRTSSVDDLRPWGDSAAAPTITLDFDAQQKSWHLVKSFLQRKRCDLKIDSDSYSEDEAEEKLAELLGFQFSAKGVSKPEHWGVPGLLWVEQGTGQNIEQAVEHAGDHLKSALNSLVGEVASTGGDELIEQVKARWSDLFTPTGKPRGDYQKLEKEREEHQQEIDELQARIQKYQEQVDRLGKLTQDYERTQHERPWEEAERQLEQAKERYRQVEKLEQQQAREKETLTHLQNNQQLLRQNQEQLQSLNKKLDVRKTELDKAQRELEQAEARTPSIAGKVQEAKAAYEAAAKQVDQARLQETRSRLEQDIRRLEQHNHTLTQNLDKARQYQQELEQAREQSRQNQINAKAVKALKNTEHQLKEENIRSQTIATRLTWQLEPGVRLALNEELLEGQGERQLLEESSLVVPGVGTLGITPGGEDLASTQRKLSTLGQGLAEQMKTLGVDSVQQAEHRVVAYEAAERTLQHTRELLKSVAPVGIEQLLADQKETQSQLQKAKTELENSPVPEPGQQLQVTDVASAEAGRAQAETRLAEAEAEERKHQTELLTRRQTRDNAKSEWQQLQDEVQNPEHQKQLQKLSKELAEIEDKRARLETTLQAREQEIQQARPAILRQDIERYQRSISTLRQTQEERQRELRDIQVRLEAWGAEGLEEQRNDKVAELEQCNRRYQELDRRARALDLLLILLTEKRQALTRRLQAPLQKHLDHYLSLLFPQATLEVDEHLRPGTFTRGTELGQIAELSFGAREQMGLISRLAYADLLREAGRPTLVILDDTLVHSDTDRLDDMKRILFDAANRHQILLFTCHPEKWSDLGVPPRDIQAMKEQGSANLV